jgi:hypothetical protein
MWRLMHLLRIRVCHAEILTATSVIVYGSALVLSSNSALQLHALRPTGEALFSEIVPGAAGVQALTGLVAIVLGILALAGTNPAILTLVVHRAGRDDAYLRQRVDERNDDDVPPRLTAARKFDERGGATMRARSRSCFPSTAVATLYCPVKLKI